MRRIAGMGLLLSGVIAASCADDPQECGPTSSCAPLSDLDVTSVMIGPVIGTHPVTGMGVVDSLLVTFTVRNNGRIATLSASASITVPLANESLSFDEAIPALEPQHSITRTTRVIAARNSFDHGWHGADTVTAHVELILPDTTTDPPDNNSRTSKIYHFARPILDVVAAPLLEPRVRVNGPLRMSVTITNYSAVATAKNIQLRHCLWDFDVACRAGNWTAFGSVPLPDIGPGQSRTLNYTTSISTTGFEEAYIYYGLAVCVAPQADTAAYMNHRLSEAWACGGAGGLEVWPDYEACNPPVLGAQPVTLTAPNCGYYPAPADEHGSTYYQNRYRRKL